MGTVLTLVMRELVLMESNCQKYAVKIFTNMKLASLYYCIFDYSTLTNYVVGVHLLGGIQRNEGIIQVDSGGDSLENGVTLELLVSFTNVK